MRKLKHSEVAIVRARILEAQGNVCAICRRPITKDAVLDHDHHTGAIRAVLHSGCNALLGKLENNAARFGVANRLTAFLGGVVSYMKLHEVDQTGLRHPTHKTEDEKRLARNKKARAVRAAKKVSE